MSINKLRPFLAFIVLLLFLSLACSIDQTLGLNTPTPVVVTATPVPVTNVPALPELTQIPTAVVPVSPETQPPVPAVVPPPVVNKPVATANTDLNIRSGPGTAYPVIGLFKAGTSTEILGVNPDRQWWWIRTANNTSGWVAAKYCTAINTDTVPVVTAPELPPKITDTPTATATSTPITPTPIVPNCPIPARWATYTIQVGDTWQLLAQRLAMQPADLQAANCNQLQLWPGRQIYVPFIPVTPGPITPTFTPTLTPTVTIPVTPTNQISVVIRLKDVHLGRPLIGTFLFRNRTNGQPVLSGTTNNQGEWAGSVLNVLPLTVDWEAYTEGFWGVGGTTTLPAAAHGLVAEITLGPVIGNERVDKVNYVANTLNIGPVADERLTETCVRKFEKGYMLWIKPDGYDATIYVGLFNGDYGGYADTWDQVAYPLPPAPQNRWSPDGGFGWLWQQANLYPVLGWSTEHRERCEALDFGYWQNRSSAKLIFLQQDQSVLVLWNNLRWQKYSFADIPGINLTPIN